MKKLLIGSAVLAALLIKENIAVNAAIEQNETMPKIAVTDKKRSQKTSLIIVWQVIMTKRQILLPGK